MFPSVVASEIGRALIDYLRTTFHLQDKRLEAGLFRFLQDSQTGMFRGPYLDVRLPFRKAMAGWEKDSPLDYGPKFAPYAHQLRAFERLSARDRTPENTLITTGTGSGKTECFLYPILDHCRRARERGELGVKAIVLYPMNALASDQAARLAKLLAEPELSGVSAGLYVGGKGQVAVSSPTELVDSRDILRKSPPDILLTNYRMLDFLLMRPEDAPLWEPSGPATLRYLVLDELHTYDGAQGSDVACLIRRLKARLGTPSGQLCCVGTSATIAGGAAGDPGALLADFATQIFGESFDGEGLIGEDRLSPEEAFTNLGASSIEPYTLVEGDWKKLSPSSYSSWEPFIEAQVPLWFEGKRVGPAVLGNDLGAHPFMSKLLRALSGRERRSGPRHVDEVMAAVAREESAFAELPRERQWLVLSSFLSLVAHARAFDSTGQVRPFLHVQLQLWLREVHGLLCRLGGDTPRFAWQEELKAQEGEHWLPLVYCRECGWSAFAATKREGEAFLRAAPGESGEAFLHGGTRGRVIAVTSEVGRPNIARGGQVELLEQYLCARCLKLGEESLCHCTGQSSVNLRVRVYPEHDEENQPLPLRRCPACQAEDALGFLASRAATLSSVAVSELFSSHFNTDKKPLAFTDSVQDASHRAGFFAARTFRFTMRTVIQSLVEHAYEPTVLSEFASRLIDHWFAELGEAKAAALLLPPDLVEDPAYVAYFGLDEAEALRAKHRPTKAQRAALRKLLEARTGWEVTRELGLAVTYGRSLDATACATLSFDDERLAAAAQSFTEELREHHRGSLRREPDLQATCHFLEGLLQRLRFKGGILHALLVSFAQEDSAYFLTKRKNPHISRFGPHFQLPTFFVQGEATPKSTYQALHSSSKARTWIRVWATRALGLVRQQDPAVNSLVDRAVRALGDQGLLEKLQGPGGCAVFGIAPEHSLVTGAVERVRCETLAAMGSPSVRQLLSASLGGAV